MRRTAECGRGGGAAATDQFFAFDGYEPVLQFDGTAASDLSNRNLFRPAVDQILAVEDVTSLGSTGNVLWALSDHLGTPRDVADLNEGTGVTTVTNHRTYNSFGTQISETNAAVDFLFGETGKILDDLTGANIHLFRWLRGGQWLSEDRSGFAAGDANLRRYVHNSPTNFIDPDGLEEKKAPLTPWQKFGAFLSGVAGPGIPVSEVDEAIKDAMSVDTLVGAVLGPSIPLNEPERAVDLLGPSTKLEDLAEEEANGEFYRKLGQPVGECAMAYAGGKVLPGGAPQQGPKIKLPVGKSGTKPFDGSVGMRPKKGVPTGASGKQGKPVDRLKEQPKRSAPVDEKPKDPGPPELDVPKDPSPAAPSSTTGPAKEGIYEFPDMTRGKKRYVGETEDFPRRLKEHEADGRLVPGTETTTPVPGGKLAREVAEHKRIQEITGGQKAKNCPDVANKKDPNGPRRRPGLGLPEPRD